MSVCCLSPKIIDIHYNTSSLESFVRALQSYFEYGGKRGSKLLCLDSCISYLCFDSHVLYKLLILVQKSEYSKSLTCHLMLNNDIHALFNYTFSQLVMKKCNWHFDWLITINFIICTIIYE